MSVRDFLYANFENFDKPTEDEFKVFIDFAGEPTKFTNRTVAVASDILTDLNAETFVVGIRDTYIITYGIELYILFGLEGTYGDGGLLIDNDHIALIGTTNTNSLTENLIVNANISGAGIKAGDVFPSGTPLEELWKNLLVKTTIYNLRYEANNTTGFVRVGSDLNITKFQWTIGGEPENLHLQDSDGQYSEDVTGAQITVSETYNYTAFKKLTWTLSGSNVSSITKNTYWVEPSYYGKNTTGLIPTAGEITAGVEHLSLTEDGITVPINTLISEYGWVAVENTQANGLYSRWWISEFNNADLGPTSFMKYIGNVNVTGKIYNVYIYNYPTQVNLLNIY